MTNWKSVWPFLSRWQMAVMESPLRGKLTCWIYHLNRQDELAVDINGKTVAARNIRRFPAGKRRGGLPGPATGNLVGRLPTF